MKVLIADDEAPARNKLVKMLEAEDELEIVKVCENGLEALDSLIELKPEVAFLDIQMPGLTGLEVVKKLPNTLKVSIIFVTAFNEYAIDAFDLHAMDYLLKPYSKERFLQALGKVQAIKKIKPIEETQKKLDAANEQIQAGAIHKIPVPVGDRFKLLDYSEVVSIEVDERATYVYTTDKAFPVHLTLDSCEKKLPPTIFLKVSRSAIVNLSAVKELVIWFGNRYKIIMKNGREIVSSREKSRALKDLLKF